MRISKDGRLTLTKNDRRVGNFVYSNHADRVAFSDINLTVRTSVSKRTLAGRMLAEAVEGGMDTFLHNYAGFLYYVNGIAPDREFLEDVMRAAGACLERHPELYGGAGATDAEDAEVTRGERELVEFGEAVGGLPPDGE